MPLSRLMKLARGNRKHFSLSFLRCVISWFGIVSITMGWQQRRKYGNTMKCHMFAMSNVNHLQLKIFPPWKYHLYYLDSSSPPPKYNIFMSFQLFFTVKIVPKLFCLQHGTGCSIQFIKNKSYSQMNVIMLLGIRTLNLKTKERFKSSS